MMFDYTAEQPDELSVEVGEVLEVVSKEVDEGWWKVGSVSLYLCLCVCVFVCACACMGGMVGCHCVCTCLNDEGGCC